MELDALPSGKPDGAVAVVARKLVHTQVLRRGQPAAWNLAADHEHVMLADALFSPRLAGVAIFLLIRTVELEQLLVLLVKVVCVLLEFLGDGPTQLPTPLLNSLSSGPLRCRGPGNGRSGRGNFGFSGHQYL